jgi:hypothetical protein
MKRFVKEYANYQLVNSPFLSDICNSLYKHRIISAVCNCEKGFITVNEAMEMILHAEQYVSQDNLYWDNL